MGLLAQTCSVLLGEDADEEQEEDEADGGAGTNAGFVNDADGDGGGDEAGDDGALLLLVWRWSIMMIGLLRQ